MMLLMAWCECFVRYTKVNEACYHIMRAVFTVWREASQLCRCRLFYCRFYSICKYLIELLHIQPVDVQPHNVHVVKWWWSSVKLITDLDIFFFFIFIFIFSSFRLFFFVFDVREAFIFTVGSRRFKLSN